MSGLIGHTLYGVLAEKAIRSRGLCVAPLISRHRASFLCGAYLGADIVTMPEAVCTECRFIGRVRLLLELADQTGGMY